MFHSYWLDSRACPYVGVDLTILKKKGKPSPQLGQWAQLMMGLTPTPFLSIKSFLWGGGDYLRKLVRR
eukprot:15365168-Ditylum_brightwellii.AAC.1